MSETETALPPVVYVATQHDDHGVLRVEYQRLADGRVGLFCYSAIDRLHRWYRENSPWMLVSQEGLQEIHDQAPYDALFLDSRIEPEGGERA